MAESEQLDMFDDEFQEDESDLSPTSAEDISNTVMHSTDWTIETILSQIDKGNILLDPKFQRRDAWREKRKSEFIESLFLGLPIPQIVLASHESRKGKYIVIDGKQRLLSIKQFASSVDDKNNFQELKLQSLSVRKELNGHSLQTLKDDSRYDDDVNAFENETIRTVVIKSWPNEDFLYRVFLRLNTNSVGLSPQELRQALHPGEFIDFVDTASQDSRAIKEMLRIGKPDFRMRDVEILIRYYAFRYFIKEYKGSMKSFLDETCKRFNQQWAKRKEEIKGAVEDLELAHKKTQSIFKNNAYRKWTGEKYESRFNRAVFDTMVFYFVKEDVHRRIPGHEQELEDAFKELCETDKDFIASIERTTKTVDATCCRLSKWAEILNKVLGTDLHVFQVKNRRIV